jgi:hypothetical protein
MRRGAQRSALGRGGVTPPLSRDLGAAQAAFESNDPALSRAAHTPIPAGEGGTAAAREAGHNVGERTVRHSFCYGGLDGIAGSCVLFAAAVAGSSYASSGGGGAPQPGAVLSVVAHGLLGLGAAVGAREYARFASRNAHFERERDRERWELSNYDEGERREMKELYVSRGVAPEHASAIIDLFARYRDFFVELMMVQELCLALPDSRPVDNAAAAVAGFALFGSVPLLTTLAYSALQSIGSGGGAAAASGGVTAWWPLLPGGKGLQEMVVEALSSDGGGSQRRVSGWRDGRPGLRWLPLPWSYAFGRLTVQGPDA